MTFTVAKPHAYEYQITLSGFAFFMAKNTSAMSHRASVLQAVFFSNAVVVLQTILPIKKKSIQTT